MSNEQNIMQIETEDGHANTTKILYRGEPVRGVSGLSLTCAGPDTYWRATVQVEFFSLIANVLVSESEAVLDDRTAEVVETLPAKFIRDLAAHLNQIADKKEK